MASFILSHTHIGDTRTRHTSVTHTPQLIGSPQKILCPSTLTLTLIYRPAISITLVIDINYPDPDPDPDPSLRLTLIPSSVISKKWTIVPSPDTDPYRSKNTLSFVTLTLILSPFPLQLVA